VAEEKHPKANQTKPNKTKLSERPTQEITWNWFGYGETLASFWEREPGMGMKTASLFFCWLFFSFHFLFVALEHANKLFNLCVWQLKPKQMMNRRSINKRKKRKSRGERKQRRTLTMHLFCICNLFLFLYCFRRTCNSNTTFHFSHTHFPISQMRRWLRLRLRLRLQLERSARKRVQSDTNNNKSNWFMAPQCERESERESEAMLTPGSQAAWARERV